MEKLGLSPPSSQRAYHLISQLCFPDVSPHDERGRRVSDCPDFLIKLPPELLSTNRGFGSLTCVMKGVPFVIWLYNRLNVEDSVSYSVKRDGPLCCVNVNNMGPGHKGSYTCKKFTSAGDAECSTVMKGWHLHAFGPSARSGFYFGPPLIHTASHPDRAEAHVSTWRQHISSKV